MARKKKDTAKPLPLDVIEANMVFYHEKAEKLTTDLIRRLNDMGTSASQLIALYKDLLNHRDLAVQSAAKAAPYRHSKLESHEIRTQEAVRFVIQAPEPIDDVNVWLERCKAEMSGRAVADDLRIDRAIEHARLKNSHATETIEDEENPLDEIPE
jgi:hypothetical protein